MDAGPLAANRVAFGPSGKTLAVAGADGRVRLLDLESGAASVLPGGGGGALQSVAFCHQGATLLSAGSDGEVTVWTGVS